MTDNGEYVPVDSHAEVADLMVEGVTLYRRIHLDHDCCDECDSLDAERREVEEYVFGQPRNPSATGRTLMDGPSEWATEQARNMPPATGRSSDG